MERVDFSVKAAERLNGELNAFLEIDRQGAVKRAEVERGGVLAGVPVAVKDNICVKGMQASCGSRILQSDPATTRTRRDHNESCDRK